jgi:hypothetical protein
MNAVTFEALVNRLLPFVGSLLVYPKESKNMMGCITGGTAFFVGSGQQRFLVTAEHVIREIEKLRGERDIVVLLCGVNSPPTEISSWPIHSRDDFVDICTVQVPNEFVSNELEKKFFPFPDEFTEVEKGDHVLVLGYPAAHRQCTSDTVNTRCLPHLYSVTDVGPRHFSLANEKNNREILINPELLEYPEHLGGMSGSPVFRIKRNSEPQFVGVFVGGGDGLHGVCFCSHAYFLLSTGSLDYGRIPPR